MSKRILSLLLAMVMLLSVVPFQALAEDVTEPEATVETEAPVIPEATQAPSVPETTVAPTVPATTEASVVETSAPEIPDTTEAPAVPETTEAAVVPETTDATEAPMEEPDSTEEAVDLMDEELSQYAVAGSIVTVPAADALEAEREVLAGEKLELTARDTDDPNKTFLWEFANPDDAGYALLTSGGVLKPYPQAVLERKTVTVQAYVLGDEQKAPVATLELILVPRVSRVALTINGENVTGGDYYVNIAREAGVVIDAELGPKDSRQKVKWSVSGDESLYINRTEEDTSIAMSHQDKSGVIMVTATAADKDSTVKATVTIHFAKYANKIEITNLPDKDEDGAYFLFGGQKRALGAKLEPNENLSNRDVIWQVVDGDAVADPETGKYPDSQHATIGRNTGKLVTKTVEERTAIKVLAWVAGDPGVAPDEKEIILYPCAEKITASAEDVENGKVELSRGTVALKAEILPEAAMQNVTWTISNPKLACFQVTDDNGETKEASTITDTMTPALKLKAAGNVRITAAAKDGSGKKAYVNLKITAPVEELTITPVLKAGEDPDALRLASGSSMNLKAETWTVYDENDPDSCLLAQNQKVTWTIGEWDENGNLVKTSAASISAAGRIAAGIVEENTTVTARARSVENKEVYDEVDVTITPRLARTFAVFVDGGKFSEAQNLKTGSSVLMDAVTDYQFYGKYYDREAGEYFDVPAEECTFRSSNSKVASVDENGNLTTGKSGSASIYVSWCDDADGGRMQTIKVNVKVQALVNAVKITQPSSLYVRSGSSLGLKAIAWNNMDADVKAANQKFTWSVVDFEDLDEEGNAKESSEFATMSGSTLKPKTVTEMKVVRVFARSAENGLTDYIDITILPKSVCQLTLSYTLEGEDPKTGTVTVPWNKQKEEGLKLELYKTVIVDGEVTPDDYLDDSLVTWSTSNKKVIAIENGVPVFKGVGKATLTAKYTDKANKLSATAKITLNLVNAVTEVVIKTKIAGQELVQGRSIYLMAEVTAENDGVSVKPTNKNVVWSFADEDSAKYATINPRSGMVVAKRNAKSGATVKVKAIAADGFGAEDTFELVIKPLAEKVTIDGYKDGQVVTVHLSKTNSIYLKATVESKDASQNVKWTSSSSSYASVDQTGKVTLKRGKRKVKITATATDGSGKKASITLDIKND